MEGFTPEEQQTDLIERYLTGALPSNESAMVDQRIKEDAAFAKEVAKYRFILDGFRSLEAEQFREKVSSWKKNSSGTNRSLLTQRWSMAAAAAIVLLLGIAFAFRWLSSSPPLSSQELYAMHMSDFVPDIHVRSDSEGKDSLALLLSDALNSYQAGSYTEAIPKLGQWFDAVSDSSIEAQTLANAYLALGVSYLQEQQAEEALQALRSIPSTSVYFQHAQWYQAMAHLQAGDGPAARGMLEDLKEDPYYRDRVGDVLGRMRE